MWTELAKVAAHAALASAVHANQAGPGANRPDPNRPRPTPKYAIATFLLAPIALCCGTTTLCSVFGTLLQIVSPERRGADYEPVSALFGAAVCIAPALAAIAFIASDVRRVQRLDAIVLLAQRHGRLTKQAVAQHLGIPEPTAEQLIAIAVRDGFVDPDATSAPPKPWHTPPASGPAPAAEPAWTPPPAEAVIAPAPSDPVAPAPPPVDVRPTAPSAMRWTATCGFCGQLVSQTTEPAWLARCPGCKAPLQFDAKPDA